MGNNNNTNNSSNNISYSRELRSLKRNTIALQGVKDNNFIISLDSNWKSNNEIEANISLK